MGFSVSGSAAIIFAALFIAFGAFHSAATDSFERVTDAQQAQGNENVDQKNTAISITSTTYGSDTLTVEVKNTGGTYILINETDLIVDNEYETGWRTGGATIVNGPSDTFLWFPGETLKIEITETSQPSRVKVATEHGVADSEVV